MKAIISTLLLAAMTLTASAQKVKPISINITAHDKSINDIQLQYGETDTIFALEAVGDTTGVSKELRGTITVNVTEPTYAVLTYRWKRSTVWLEPGKDFSVVYDLTPAALTAEFTSKKADANVYLNSGKLKGPVMGDFGRPEDEILDILAEYEKNCYAVLDSYKKLTPDFKQKERLRLQFWIYGFLAQYAQQHPCGDAIYERLSTLASQEGDWLMQTSDYTNFMFSAVTALALRDFDAEESEDAQTRATTQVLEYAAANVKNAQMREIVIGTNAVKCVANNGTDGCERLKEIFDANVTDPEIRSVFETAWADGARLKKGRMSPGFDFESIDGSRVTLASLRGRYVYIDCWATWCVPCRRELPALQKMEEAFQGTNIAFVSISCDEDKTKWQQMVKENQMGGIQLWAGPDSDFLNAYHVQAIPRFIFIGPDGRIIDPDMTRPTDPTTVEALGMVAMPLDMQ